MTKVWYAKEAVIKVGLASAVTISTASALDVFFSGGTTGTAIEGVMKDVSITEPTLDVDKIDLLGTTSSFQNAELEEKPAGMVEVTGTAILPGDEVSEAILFGTVTGATGFTRYRSGLATARKLAFLLNVTDGTDEVNYAGNNMVMSAHETKVTGADGHFEVTWTLKCLPADWFGPEFKD